MQDKIICPNCYTLAYISSNDVAFDEDWDQPDGPILKGWEELGAFEPERHPPDRLLLYMPKLRDEI